MPVLFPLRCCRIWCGRRRVAPDEEHPAGIRNIHSFSEKLCDQFCVRCLSTSRTSSRELKKRLFELASFYCRLFVFSDNFRFHRNLSSVIEECLFACILFHVAHNKSFLTLLARADICTRSTSCTVISGYCDSELHIRHTDHRNRLHSFRSISSFFFCQSYRTDNSMRTYICTAVTLDTVVRLPDRNVYRDTTFLVCGRSWRS